MSQRQIAALLNRSPSTISRELGRNRFGPFYRAWSAHRLATERKSKSHCKARLKKPRLGRYVESRIKQGWSPQIIAGRLRLKLGRPVISHEAIYQWIYAEKPDLIDWLARGRRKRRKRGSCRNKGHQIPGRIPIRNRDQEANNRADFGHLEADTIVSRASSCCICASIDRKTRFLCLSKMKRCTAHEMSRALIKSWSPLHFSKLLKTITYDNGKENFKHQKTNEILASRAFFARPYRSCDKGGIEQCIGLVRRFLPKKTDFALISQNKLNIISQLLNSRPRKCLGFRSPLEALALHFGVALTH